MVELSSVIVTGLMVTSCTITIPVINVIKEMNLKSESESILIILQICSSIVITMLKLLWVESLSGKIYLDTDLMDPSIK